ncbi:uncharacterized protein LOC123551901 isoform X2 [Mercenaria mercenaria]|uniref:uncharacterized protein LOC123551901 isoform X2 n=1 Tax=Mercenaria mercenaria TaxID=6596 RepID=UPI00234F7838|nr:uncharacterized protein LOC123551901 isoform X2 [Mercenaria mercenaria]
MKLSFLYPCAVFILCCTVIKTTVCVECYQEKCQLLSMTDNLILFDSFLGEHFGSLYSKIKNESDRMPKTDCLNVNRNCIWTCDSNTPEWCRKCKKEYCKQQTCGDFGGCNADAFYLFETFKHYYLKSNYDRRSECGSSNLTGDSHNECCKRRKCGSAETFTKGERVHKQEPFDKLLPSLQLSLMISFITTAASLCSMVFMCIIWSYSHLASQIPSSQRQKRKRQKKKMNRTSKQTINNTTEKNVNGSSKQDNNEATKQNVIKESKPDDNKVSEQSENCRMLLSTNREVSSASTSVTCVSQSSQTENPAAGSENELCTSATQVKQCNFSYEADYIRQEEIKIIETEDYTYQSNNKSIENERVILSPPVLEDLYDLLSDSDCTDRNVTIEVSPSLNMMNDFDQEQTLSYLKLPDPSIHDTEETFPKGSQNIQNGCGLFHHEQYTYTTGYPFNTVSTEPLTRTFSSLVTSREDERFSEYEYTEDVNVARKHLNVKKSSFENNACSENEGKDCVMNMYSEKQVPEKDEFEHNLTNKKELMNQASGQTSVILHFKSNEESGKNEKLPENVSAAEQNRTEKLFNTVLTLEQAEIPLEDDSELCNAEDSYLANSDLDTARDADHNDHDLCQVNIESYPSDSGVSGHESAHQRIINIVATNILSKETKTKEAIAHDITSGPDLTNKDDKRSDDIMSDNCKTIEEAVEENNCTESKENHIQLSNNLLDTSGQVGETLTFEDGIEKPIRKNYLSKQRKQSTRRRVNYKKSGKKLSENRLCKCQRGSPNCFEQKKENKCLSYNQTDSTTQVGETVQFTGIDSCSNLQQCYFLSNDLVTVNSSGEESNRHTKSASDINLCQMNIRVVHCSKTYVSKNRYEFESKVKNRKRHFKGLARRCNKSPNGSSLDLPSVINDGKENGKKKFCKVCHKLNVLCRRHRRKRDPCPEYGTLTRQCSTRLNSTKCRNYHTKKKENKLSKTEQVVSLVYQDSGFISGKSTKYDSWPAKFPTFCDKSSVKLFHDYLLKEITLEKLSFDFFQQLKVLQDSIEDIERQLVAKEISRELHIEHRNFAIFGLDSYFDRLNNGPPPTTRERMQYEWIRLASFHNYTGNGNALALARNGFYHDHNEGPMSTRCYLCEARSSDWEMFDDISAEHRRQSPNCPFHDNREEESMNISITNGDNSEIPARSSPSSIGIAGTSSVTSSSSTSTGAAAIREVSSSFQGINITQTRVDNSGGESIPHQPTEDPESRDRSLLALSQPRTQRALGRTGYSYSTIIAPRRNNVAAGAISNVGIDPLNSGSSSLRREGQLPSTRPSSILGGPVGAGAFSGLRTAGPNTGALTSVSRATEGFQQSNAPSTSTEARQTNPAPGAGGRTDPTITVVVDNPKHPDYVNIDSRVSSYQGWPDYLDQTPRQMSEAGFFYVGVADFTRCYCCGGGLRNWEPGDDPMLEHTRWFPRCEYVNKLKGERYVAAVQRRHQEHMAEQQRQQIEIAQRRDENRNPPDPMTTEAAAVMREMGYSADRTREAILAVRRQTGSSMVTTQQVLTWLLDDEERRLTGNSSNTELGIRPPPFSTATSLVGTSTPSSVVYTGTNIPSSIVHTGTSIGTSIVNTTSSISTATSIVSAGSATSTVSSSSASIPAEVQQSVTSASVTAGGSSSASQNQQTGSGNSSSSNSASRTSIEKQSGASGDASEESKSTAKEDAKSLKAENEKLREMQTCKICMERAVNTTLLPCGHLVCCDTCAARLQRCPICRKRIKGTVKTFMS